MISDRWRYNQPRFQLADEDRCRRIRHSFESEWKTLREVFHSYVRTRSQSVYNFISYSPRFQLARVAGRKTE